jgi:hypothetical protein
MEATAKRQTCVKTEQKRRANVTVRVGPTAALCVTHMRQSGQCYHRRATRTHHCPK